MEVGYKMTWILFVILGTVLAGAFIIYILLQTRHKKNNVIEVEAIVGESKWNKRYSGKSLYDAELIYIVDGKEIRTWMPLNKYDGSSYDSGTTFRIICNKKRPKKIIKITGQLSKSGKI